jgi:peptide deformylase
VRDIALREIRKIDDEVLRKKSRRVDKVDERILTLIEDMIETMYDADGVGLAAPQVGILRRVAVIDVGEGIVKLINPEIVSFEGGEIEEEGCLSIPNRREPVKRPEKVTVKALDETGNEITIEGSGLFARALCHEIDHLEGILFIDKVERQG